MLPVHIVELNLYEVPMVFLVQFHQGIKAGLVSVKGESEISDASLLPLLHQEIHHPIVHESFIKLCHASAADGVEEIVVQMVGLEIVQRVMVHLQRDFP